jgi:hypothetical protein
MPQKWLLLLAGSRDIQICSYETTICPQTNYEAFLHRFFRSQNYDLGSTNCVYVLITNWFLTFSAGYWYLVLCVRVSFYVNRDLVRGQIRLVPPPSPSNTD